MTTRNGAGLVTEARRLVMELGWHPSEAAQDLDVELDAVLRALLGEHTEQRAAEPPASGQRDRDTRRDTTIKPLTSDGDTGDSGDTPSVTPVSRRTSWTAAELVAIEFPPPKWAVPGLIAEGVNLLAGAPKIGKSWMSLGLAVDIASGGQAFGTVTVEQGDVLYLALEDTGRRLKNRLLKVLAGKPAPKRLTLATSCPPFPEGAAHIRRWLDNHPDARLVVIDVLAKMRGPVTPNASAYTADYAAVTDVKRIADEYGIAVVLVHHVRKAGSDDFLAEVSGTHGIAGAADAILVLKRSRGTADGALHITGRDVDEAEHALRFDPDTGRWTRLDGPAVDHLVGETRAAILAYVRAHPGHTPKKIADGADLDYELVKKTCPRMAEDGQLTNDGRGHYSTVTAVPAVPPAGQSGDSGVPEVSPLSLGDESEPSANGTTGQWGQPSKADPDGDTGTSPVAADTDADPPLCEGCGQKLLHTPPGRTVCEHCRIARKESA